MKAVFVELPAFERKRGRYLDDDGFRQLQLVLMSDPTAGDVIEETGGLRKLRYRDVRRGKGKRGGLRLIYFYWIAGREFWLFTLFDKDEAADLDAEERKALKNLLKCEIRERLHS